jgi:hypothetical protein
LGNRRGDFCFSSSRDRRAKTKGGFRRPRADPAFCVVG